MTKRLAHLTFITHVNMNSTVMWVILQNNAGWDCFKTPILQEILRTPSLFRVEHCAFLEVIHLFHSVGCVRNKLQLRTVQQNQKSFPWTQDWVWTVYPRLIYGIWSSQFFTETLIRIVLEHLLYSTWVPENDIFMVLRYGRSCKEMRWEC